MKRTPQGGMAAAKAVRRQATNKNSTRSVKSATQDRHGSDLEKTLALIRKQPRNTAV